MYNLSSCIITKDGAATHGKKRFAKCFFTHGKAFAECATKNTQQTHHCRHNFAMGSLPSVVKGIWGFADCRWQSANNTAPVVVVNFKVLEPAKIKKYDRIF